MCTRWIWRPQSSMESHLLSRELGWRAPVAWMLWYRIPPLVSVPSWFQTGPRLMFRWPKKRKSSCCNVTIPRESSQNGSGYTNATGFEHTQAASMVTGNWWKNQFQTIFVPKSKENAMLCCSNTFEVTNGDGNTLASTCCQPLAKPYDLWCSEEKKPPCSFVRFLGLKPCKGCKQL